MIAEIRFKNMFSFRDEAILSFEADRSKDMESYHVVELGGKNQNLSVGKIRSKLEIIFLPYEGMQEQYLYLEKFPFLLPVAWIQRIFRTIVWRKDKITSTLQSTNIEQDRLEKVKKVMDALELEHLEEEKLTAAIQQGAGRKAIEVVRAERSVQMKSVLAELNMEQFRRVPLYESYMANEITEEQYHAELMDYEEAHRKLNERLTAIMEDTLVWERALSLRNPWIQQMAQYKTPEELDRNFVKKYIEQVTVTLLGDGQAKISLTMKTDEWKQMISRIEVEGTDSGTKE